MTTLESIPSDTKQAASDVAAAVTSAVATATDAVSEVVTDAVDSARRQGRRASKKARKSAKVQNRRARKQVAKTRSDAATLLADFSDEAARRASDVAATAQGRRRGHGKLFWTFVVVGTIGAAAGAAKLMANRAADRSDAGSNRVPDREPAAF
ncbi:hypothetical protein SAMN05444157_0221 [Frankineae bacterium MT45]|nr:hypothetical protein SAMN05444157_0221 [Frankineae bacterium MT45]